MCLSLAGWVIEAEAEDIGGLNHSLEVFEDSLN
jgi:hypothetical protein